MRQFTYIAFFFLLAKNVSGQDIIKIDTSYFVLSGVSDAELISGPPVGFMETFCAYRASYNNGTFMETSFFGQETFRIDKGKWYIKKGRKWSQFFSVKRFKKETLSFSDYYFVLIPWEAYRENNNETLYKYYIVAKDYLENISPYQYVLFSPARGFVGIVNDEVVLTRVDHKPKVHLKCK